jgi:large subunit ribosomal protein L10
LNVEEKKKMSASKQKRSAEIQSLKSMFEGVQGGVVTDYRGLDVDQISDLRRRFRERGVGYKVVKNTLTRKAVEGTNYQDLTQFLTGPTGIAFTEGDPIAPAQVAVEFSKDHEDLEVKGGFMEGQVLSVAEILEVSKLSGVKELKAQFLATLNGPAQKFLGVLNAAPQKFLGVLMAQAEKMETS